MSIHKAIDQIVEAFIPEMARISEMHESEDQKERHYKAWLRATFFFSRRRSVELRLVSRILLGRPRLVETKCWACAHGGWVGGGGGANPGRGGRGRGSLEAGIGGLRLRAHRRGRVHSGAAAGLPVGLRCRDSPRRERRPGRASDRRYQPRSRRPPRDVVAYRAKLSLCR